jgi:hypothetical protein
VTSLKSRFAFLLISKLYRQMYANTGIAIDSARVTRSVRWARWMAKPCRMLFAARRMPDSMYMLKMTACESSTNRQLRAIFYSVCARSVRQSVERYD